MQLLLSERRDLYFLKEEMSCPSGNVQCFCTPQVFDTAVMKIKPIRAKRLQFFNS
jgi:hypothetical protein